MTKLRATQQRRQQQLAQGSSNNSDSNSNNRGVAKSDDGVVGHSTSNSSTTNSSTNNSSTTNSNDSNNSINLRQGKQNKKNKKKGRGGNKRRNDLLQPPTNNVWGPNECSQEALAAMGNRMLDWFSVIRADDHRGPGRTPARAPPTWCKREVSWMLQHLDRDGSGSLEARELYQLEHDDRERCIKPFLDRCDLDRDGRLAQREWCKCFDKTERPCAALRTASQGLLGGYIPECDSEGWYRPVQCHGSERCWCVDRHGVEQPDTRTRGSPPRCETTAADRGDDDDDDDDEDEDDEETILEGSADMLLEI